MKSYKVVKNGEPLEEQQEDIPSPSGEQVLIKTIACGVCHTDVHIHDGYFDLGNDVHIPARATNSPITMGHEVYGEVVQIGENVKGIDVGKKYVVYPWIGCGECFQC